MSVGHENGGNSPSQSAAGAQNPADWDTLKEDVSEIAETAVERGKHFMDAARLQATDYADKRKNDVAQSVADLAHSLREATQSFEDRPNIRAFSDSAAEGLDQLAETIKSRSFADIYDDVEDVMRRRPAAIAAVTAVAGFMIARFIRASSEGARGHQQAGYGGARPSVRRTANASRGAAGGDVFGARDQRDI